MFAHRSISPPKIRLKAENYEKYESFFSRKKTSRTEFKNSSPAVAFKPLNPPPFTLSNVQEQHSLSSNRSTPTLPCQSRAVDGVSVITPNESHSHFPSEALNADRKKDGCETSTSTVTRPNDTHDAAVLLASIRNLVVEKETITPVSFMPQLPHIEKHFKRDDDKKKIELQESSALNQGFSAYTSTVPPSSITTSLNQSPFLSVRARAVSMDVASQHASALRKPLLGGLIHLNVQDARKESESPNFISPPSSPAFHPLPDPIGNGTRKPMPMITTTIHRRVADRRKRYLEERSSSFEYSDDDDNSSEDEQSQVTNVIVTHRRYPSPSRPSAAKRLKSSTVTSPTKTSRSPKSPSKKSKKTTTSTNHKNQGSKSSSARSNSLVSTSNSTPRAILRKKFSWKNFPELEAFLIENREEYLRHSALNYTMQQKQFNNRLTERLIELASTSGYVFDPDSFTFVTIRDRIRCYFKSYVQSRKKRGVIIGYAARKAGLLGVKEVEKKASGSGGTGSSSPKNSRKKR
eukprot:CAMPEP_0204627988 /NCGR_PEP_ID=MMETSP0717-20131115/14699_1 /ASSEMBLY_ACC=CAM_ASM_000666 /TAXON_ID=230516 /ORGANISM="Chaetoceros curvisetus" /LENGTH=518 /DNA_ID=CAMNT_0051644423 /DNA_START=68 /DNA_END=1624 /DNA_ORIENTATION=-